MKITKKKIIILSLSVIILAVFGYVILIRSGVRQNNSNSTKPKGNNATNFMLNDTLYECSRPIKGEWVDAKVGERGDPGFYFKPKNQEDIQKFCRVSGVIEYRAVLDILRREDVSKEIEKYSSTDTSVRALGHKYIHDKDYLKRILPAYSNLKIDCIIVVHTPEKTRFFIEDGEKHLSHKDHHYLEVSDSEFLKSLNNAPDADVNAFWLALH